MVVYLAFTGGFDSTYLLLHLIIKQSATVQPIYLGGHIDGIQKNPSFTREKTEVAQIHKIYRKRRQRLLKSHLKRLLPLIVKNIYLDSQSKIISKYLFQKGFLRRPETQFSYLLTLGKHLGRPILLGNLRTDRILYNNPYLDSVKKIFNISSVDSYGLCRKILFPLCHYGKAEIVHLSQKNGWTGVLENTRSCWYHPRNKPKSNCIQCQYIHNYQYSIRLKNELHQEMLNYRNKKETNGSNRN